MRGSRRSRRWCSPAASGPWLITRYADVRAALADPRLHKDWAGKLTGTRLVARPGHRLPVHAPAQLRPAGPHPAAAAGVEGVHRAPGRRAAAAGRGDHVVAARRMAGRGPADAGEAEVDLIEAFAFPLPVIVICELLGVPGGRPGQFKEWSHAIAGVGGEPGQFRAAGDRDVPLLQRPAGGQAGGAGRRPGVRADRGRDADDSRRLARRARAPRDAVPAAGGRARDDRQPDRQRRPWRC